MFQPNQPDKKTDKEIVGRKAAYAIAEGRTVVELGEAVSRYMTQGFSPQGGIMSVGEGMVVGSARFYQAMWLAIPVYEGEEEARETIELIQH